MVEFITAFNCRVSLILFLKYASRSWSVTIDIAKVAVKNYEFESFSICDNDFHLLYDYPLSEEGFLILKNFICFLVMNVLQFFWRNYFRNNKSRYGSVNQSLSPDPKQVRARFIYLPALRIGRTQSEHFISSKYLLKKNNKNFLF